MQDNIPPTTVNRRAFPHQDTTTAAKVKVDGHTSQLSCHCGWPTRIVALGFDDNECNIGLYVGPEA